MAIPHASSGQPITLLPDTPDSGEKLSTAIFKSPNLEVMRLILAKGKTMPAHKVAGDITIQCLFGSIDLRVEDQSTLMDTGQLVYLSGGVVHALTAIEDACVLVHVVLQG